MLSLTAKTLSRLFVKKVFRGMATAIDLTSPKTPECITKTKYRLTFNGLPYYEARTLMLELQTVTDMHEVTDVFGKYANILCHQHVAMAYEQIGRFQMDLDNNFWETIFPYGKAVVSEATRDTAHSMSKILINLSKRLVQDEELWKIAVQQKLLKENLIRYIPMDILPKLFYALAFNKKGNKEIFDKMEQIFLKNIKYYQQSTHEKIPKFFKCGYDLSGRVMPAEIQEIVKTRYYKPVPLPDL